MASGVTTPLSQGALQHVLCGHFTDDACRRQMQQVAVALGKLPGVQMPHADNTWLSLIPLLQDVRKHCCFPVVEVLEEPWPWHDSPRSLVIPASSVPAT